MTDNTPEPTEPITPVPAPTIDPVPAAPEVDNLATLAPQRLAEMVREKRTAEATARRELRDTQASVENMRRQVLHSLGTLHRVRDQALDDLDRHLPIDTLLTDAGQIDTEKVTTALDVLAQTHPHLFVPAIAPRSTGDSPPSGEPTPRGAKATWSGVLGRR